PNAGRGRPQNRGQAARRARGHAALTAHPARRRPGLAGDGLPDAEAPGRAGRVVRRRRLLGGWGRQPVLPVLVAVVPQPLPGRAAEPGPGDHPFTWSGVGGHFQVTTFPGTFAAFGAGAAMLLAAPWVTRAVVAADRWLVRGLLGPGRLTQRVHDLERPAPWPSRTPPPGSAAWSATCMTA